MTSAMIGTHEARAGDMRPSVIFHLEAEHARLEAVLALIEQSWNGLETLEPPDFTLMLDAVKYTRRYLCVIHWPKEAALLGKALERHCAGRRILEPFLLQDHALFEESSERVFETLSRAHNGEVVRREHLMKQGSQWTARLRRLIRQEERTT